jgi:hypothetical protein
MVNSRAKGVGYESEIKNALFDNLGLVFKRELNQYREADHGDLICEVENFPFVIECKRRVSGGFKQAWMEQAQRAADRVGKFPCVIYRFDRQPSIAVIRINAFAKAVGGDWDENLDLVSMTVDAFCSIARELLAITPIKVKPVRKATVNTVHCHECNGLGVVTRHPSTEYLDIFPSGDGHSKEIICDICDGHGKIYPDDEDE